MKPVGIAILCVLAAAQTKSVAGPDAVWQPAAEFLPAMRRDCENARKAPDCFVEQMLRTAPPAAVAFTRAIHNQGWMTQFRETGRVDVAYVTYPFRANENQGWLLVNGSPSLFDPDGPGKLPTDSWKKDHPRAMLFPGDRFHAAGPVVLDFGDGSQEFIADYQLRDGCHACSVVGFAFFGFDFSAKGKFTSVHDLGIEEPSAGLKWPVQVRQRQKFELSIGGAGWQVDQPPADWILRGAGEGAHGLQLEVVGTGATQMSLHNESTSVVLKVTATAALRR